MSRTLTLALLLVLPVTAMSGKNKNKDKAPEAPAATENAVPDDAAAAIVKYRHRVMEGAAKHMGAASMIAKGEITRAEDMVLHATALHGVAKAIPTLFPAGTEPDKLKSDSLPAVWTNWDDFMAKNKAFEDATAKLLELANAGDIEGFKGQFGAVGQSCGGCHDDYRVDDDE